MNSQIKRRFFIILATLLIVTIISAFLNRASFDPNFSVMDALSGATRRTHKNTAVSDTITTWNYSVETLALPDGTAYTEETVTTEAGSYVLLRKTDLPQNTLVILSNQTNNDYTEAVLLIAEYYESCGFTVKIRAYNETMMLSLAHAGHFDLFLLRKEATS